MIFVWSSTAGELARTTFSLVIFASRGSTSVVRPKVYAEHCVEPDVPLVAHVPRAARSELDLVEVDHEHREILRRHRTPFVRGARAHHDRITAGLEAVLHAAVGRERVAEPARLCELANLVRIR